MTPASCSTGCVHNGRPRGCPLCLRADPFSIVALSSSQPTGSPSSPDWTSTFTAHNWNSAKCNVLASLPTEGTFIGGGIEAATTSSFDLNGAAPIALSSC